MAPASSPTIVMTPTASVPSNLNHVIIRIVDHRLVLGDRHCRSIQRGGCAESERGDANKENMFHLKFPRVN